MISKDLISEWKIYLQIKKSYTVSLTIVECWWMGLLNRLFRIIKTSVIYLNLIMPLHFFLKLHCNIFTTECATSCKDWHKKFKSDNWSRRRQRKCLAELKHVPSRSSPTISHLTHILTLSWQCKKQPFIAHCLEMQCKNKYLMCTVISPSLQRQPLLAHAAVA